MVNELRSFLQEQLPAYMVPSSFVVLDALPLTPSGKIDQHALPAPSSPHEQPDGFVAPRNPAEAMLAEIWADVLGLPQIGAHDNFFDLGGHSLLATQVISRARTVFQAELPLRDLFEAPTIAELAARIALDHTARSQAPALVAIPRDRELPLSFAQQRLWFLDQLEPGSPFYNEHFAAQLAGPLNVAALAQSFADIVRRHEILRTTFTALDGRPSQLIAPAQRFRMRMLDLCALPTAAHTDELRRLATTEAQRPFDLARGPLMRATLLRLGEQAHLLLLTLHHIICDGWSIGVLIREMAALYQAHTTAQPAQLPELAIQYADVAYWQRQWLSAADADQPSPLREQLDYWRRSLGGTQPLLALPLDRPRPAVQTFRGATYPLRLDRALSQALKTLSRRAGVTLFMTLLAGFQTLLYRYAEQDDIAVGTRIAGRDRTEFEALIGFFINVLVLRSDLSGRPSFRTLLARVREVALGAYAHQNLPFEKLVEALQPQRSLGYQPFFQVMFVLQNVPMPKLASPGLTLHQLMIDGGTAKYDLDFALAEAPDGAIGGVLTYATDLFDATTIGRMLAHFQNVLADMAAHPDRSIGATPLLSAADRQQLLVSWNATDADYPHATRLHELFAAQVARTPDAVALRFEEETTTVGARYIVPLPQLTYRELNRRANQLAHYLQALGIGPDVLVGVAIERSPQTLIALLAILKAGGAYVPLDPSYPPALRAFMLDDAQIMVLLTTSIYDLRFTIDDLDDSDAAIVNRKSKIVNPDADWPLIARQRSDDPVCAATPQNLSHVMYTSGSTGQPKGVVVPQEQLLNRFAWMWRTWPFAPGEVACQRTTVNFSISLWELLGPLLQGIPNVIIADGVAKDPPRLIRALAAHRVSRILVVPSLLRVLLDSGGDLQHALPQLKLWSTCGEPLSRELVQRFYTSMPDARLINQYGASEVNDICFYDTRAAQHDAAVPIGRPIANARIYLLDRNLQPVPIGVPGAIHVASVGQARGYLGRPDLTAEKFIPNPFAEVSGVRYRVSRAEPSDTRYPPPDTRLYKTGDLARYRPDGTLEHLGRGDYQVKLRGIRIELGGVEAALRQHPAVRQAVVVARASGLAADDTQLIAYVVQGSGVRDQGSGDVSVETARRAASTPRTVPTPDPRPLIPELRAFLQTRLPDYMVPATFVLLDALPLTPNGKVQRAALPAPERVQSELAPSYVAPATALEQTIAAVWQSLLQVAVGVYDNFFDLGGHSLLLIQMRSQLQDRLGREITVIELFEHSTIRSLAQHFSGQNGEASSFQQIQEQADVHKAARTRRKQLREQRPAADTPGAGYE